MGVTKNDIKQYQSNINQTNSRKSSTKEDTNTTNQIYLNTTSNITETKQDLNQQNTTKSNINIISISAAVKKHSSKSPETKDTVTLSKPSGSIKPSNSNKGVNLIPLKNFTASNNAFNSDKALQKTQTIKAPLQTTTQTSPRNIINGVNQPLKAPMTARLINDVRIQLENKHSFKSPSPNRVMNTATSKYLKKSPDIAKK